LRRRPASPGRARACSSSHSSGPRSAHAWLLRYDIARRTIRQSGLARFTAACLLSGYAWLGVGGALALAHSGEFSGPVYDAALHSVLAGFVFAMIFGHAPIIFPAVLGGRAVFHRRFYAHLFLLQASVALRVAGDLSSAWFGRELVACPRRGRPDDRGRDPALPDQHRSLARFVDDPASAARVQAAP
jgi:hypothetical protein